MKIDEAKCSGCGRCHDYCTMSCISFARLPGGRVVSRVDEDECVDCGVCERSKVCGLDAIFEPEVTWPRSIRGTFSNPLIEHKETKVPGRGTEEMKTNEVTGRFPPGFAGISIELGRPGVGARLTDAGVLGKALRQMSITLEPRNPLTRLLDPVTGDCLPEVAGEKVLSAIIEFIVPVERMPEVVGAVRRLSSQVKTVISVDLVYRNVLGNDMLETVLALGEDPYPNGKTNTGLGRPRYGVRAGEVRS